MRIGIWRSASCSSPSWRSLGSDSMYGSRVSADIHEGEWEGGRGAWVERVGVGAVTLTPTSEAPDQIEPIIAYRVWTCAPGAEPPVLKSLTRTDWLPDWNHAACRPRGDESGVHEAPAEGRSCGIHAMRELEDAVDLLEHLPDGI